MWPPLFSTAVAVLMLLGSPPLAATFAFLALVNAWAAWRLHRFIRSFSTSATAAILTGVFCVIPAIVELTTAAMVDLLILALALEATHWLARFFSTGRTRDALWFGLFSTLCCLSKGNGLALAFLPLALAVITRRYDRLATPDLYIAAAMVAVVAGPPMAVAFRLDAAIGDFGTVHGHDVIERFVLYSTSVWRQFGPALVALALIGFVAAVIPGRRAAFRGVREQGGARSPRGRGSAVPSFQSASDCRTSLHGDGISGAAGACSGRDRRPRVGRPVRLRAPIASDRDIARRGGRIRNRCSGGSSATVARSQGYRGLHRAVSWPAEFQNPRGER